MARPAQALISLSALKSNYLLAKSLAGEGECLAVIKANAYGHGAVGVAKALESSVTAFGVACIEEADELRSAGIAVPILLLEGIFSDDEVIKASNLNYWLMVETDEQIRAVTEANIITPVKAWLKIDTGMHRLGVQPRDVHDIYQILKDSDNVQDEIVIATHLACADELNNDFSLHQIDCFNRAIEGIDAPVSIANSPGLLGWEQARADWNRPGYMLYGNSPFEVPHEVADQLKHVMTLKSAVISVREIQSGESVGYGSTWTAERDSLIATVTIGYGDGYPRHAPSGTPVLVDGHRARLVGRVSMDMITVDVTDLPPVEVGAEVILWGEDLPANEIGEWAGTIGYEILTRMPMRTPRIYVD